LLQVILTSNCSSQGVGQCSFVNIFGNFPSSKGKKGSFCTFGKIVCKKGLKGRKVKEKEELLGGERKRKGGNSTFIASSHLLLRRTANSASNQNKL
jgi:hypothetical protein